MAFTTTADLLPRIAAGDFKITDQQVFEAVAIHMFTQKVPARDERGDCMYRTQDNKSCAVGCLIPDAAYTPAIEGRRVRMAAAVMTGTKTAKFLGDNFELLSLLQNAHDYELGKKSLGKALRIIAAEFCLNPACINEYEPEYLASIP